MITVRKIVKTCHACPAQWDGITEDNRQIYVRYRWSHLEVSIGPVGNMNWLAAVGGETIVDMDCGNGEYSGDMDFSELKSLAADKVQFPEYESDKVDWQDEGSDG